MPEIGNVHYCDGLMDRIPGNILALTLAVGLGVLFGIGAYTFTYAEGQSYLRDDPDACINCHIMEPQYESWINSSHQHVATCNDCHAPESYVPQYLAKIDNGFRHAWAFTFDNFDEPIRAIPRNQRVTQQRCVDCHIDMAHPIVDADREPYCASCHGDVGHEATNPRRTYAP